MNFCESRISQNSEILLVVPSNPQPSLLIKRPATREEKRVAIAEAATSAPLGSASGSAVAFGAAVLGEAPAPAVTGAPDVVGGGELALALAST